MNFDWFLNQFRTKLIKQSCNNINKFDFQCWCWNCRNCYKMFVISQNNSNFESFCVNFESKKSKNAKSANFAISIRFRTFRFRCFDVIVHAKKKNCLFNNWIRFRIDFSTWKMTRILMLKKNFEKMIWIFWIEMILISSQKLKIKIDLLNEQMWFLNIFKHFRWC